MRPATSPSESPARSGRYHAARDRTSVSPATGPSEHLPATPARRFPIVVGAEALLIVMLLHFGFVFAGNPDLHALQMLALAGLGLAGWIWVIRRPSDLPWFVTLAPLPLLVASLVTSIASSYPSLSWSATWQTAMYAGIFWLLALQASRPGRAS